MGRFPTKRLVISKDESIKFEPIPYEEEKHNVFVDKKRTRFALRFAKIEARKAQRIWKRRRSNRNVIIPHKALWSFKTIETLVKRKRSEMKHWSLTTKRRDNPKYKLKLHEQLRGINILLIVRIHSAKNVPPKLESKLSKLKLLKAWYCVIVRKTPSLLMVLRDLLPFITFGVPTRAVISDLLLKRGQIFNAKTQKREVIKSNVLIERALGEYDVICMEDVVDVLITDPYSKKDAKKADQYVIAPNGRKILKIDRFDGVANAVNPFQLNAMTVAMKGLTAPFDHRGFWGYRGTFINNFLEKVI